MAQFQSYCAACATRDLNDVDRVYHDTQYGFPIDDDNELFGRLILEINQAGLSWRTILNKQENFKKAYDNYVIETVAAYGDTDRNRLLNDAGIIRNRLKINAAIHNAQAILRLREQEGSFKNWLDAHHPLSHEAWVKLFKRHFKFVGGEIVKEFLMSCGYLKGAHVESCPIHAKIMKKDPAWTHTEKSE
ncbi:DNA-3-methyladenine glycosylase I [Pseudodesulfovibrio sp. JC047]|uniref:DNA-3-methyladenine glycosylase I n=1 Tax=Pseudodesulfovibrio sp. JC047 TaxID=2683199 RepID=UPI0013D687A6|nr:DNA-3-methyladenine glycosylase I [Pseudodesulfovibrio sp. JC047]NDV19616.1 DNA-3-methyladenine glycosylase I [Pseudodesulfovibrio sp. JC047]